MKTTIRPLLIFAMVCAWSILNAQHYAGTPLTAEERAKSFTIKSDYWSRMQEKRVQIIMTESQSFKNGKPKTDLAISLKQQFNSKGQAISQAVYSTKGKLIQTFVDEYDENGNVISHTSNNAKGKLVSRTALQYTDNMLQASQWMQGKKAICKRQSTYTYNPDGNLQEVKTLNPCNGKLITRSQYAYHEDGSKQRAETYNRKGKLKWATDYACDPSGKTFASEKAELQAVCERFERDENGKTIKIVESLIGEKDRYRTITKYNERNQILESANYNEPGEITKQSVYTYNAEGYLLAIETRKEGGKLQSRAEYERDAKGLALSETLKDSEGNIFSKSRYTYTFY